MNIKVLDHGFVRLVECWGHGDAGEPTSKEKFEGDDTDYECGIIEAARQSTQASFRGWEDKNCEECEGKGWILIPGKEMVKCPKCESRGYLPGDARLLRTLFCNKPPHATPFEFAGMVLEIRAPIFVFREWHRHRTQSYNEMSARYAPLPDFNYVPTVDRCIVVNERNKQAGLDKGAETATHEFVLEWLANQVILYELFEAHYQKGLKGGIPKEVARIGMPVGRYSQMRAHTNLRNWLSFVTLRNDPGAQYEIQCYARAVAEILQSNFPRTLGLYNEKKNDDQK